MSSASYMIAPIRLARFRAGLTGTTRTNGFPRLVTVSGVRCFRTSSINLRHEFLNSVTGTLRCSMANDPHSRPNHYLAITHGHFEIERRTNRGTVLICATVAQRASFETAAEK